MVRASYLQIYNEIISDLLRSERQNLQIREDKKRGVFVEGLSEWAVRTPSEIFSLIQKGAQSRATASTKMNDVSSRSHAVFMIVVEQMTISDEGEDDTNKKIRVGKLNLVDLAGSERVRVTGATGKRLEECKKINQSLSCLGNVISALTDQKQPKSHIPYRDSKVAAHQALRPRAVPVQIKKKRKGAAPFIYLFVEGVVRCCCCGLRLGRLTQMSLLDCS